MIIPSVVFVLFIIYIALSIDKAKQHKTDMLRVKHRVHVNGIRGKSSVTRLIAASLREGGIQTAAKTTGTAARIIIDHNNDTAIKRKEANIAEQRKMLKYYIGDTHRMYTGRDYDAVVFECMAINPVYQKFLEEKVMHSTIGVITNIREDHTDALGNTLPKIARSLCATIPKNGHLITAEKQPELIEILSKECKLRNTKLHAVGMMRIAEKHMAKFNHFEYKENVAIAIKVAQLCGIDRATALAGMHSALPDPGAFALQEIKHQNKTIQWANLFAINDRESFIATVQSLGAKVGTNTKKAVILNNRLDRPERVAQFVDICSNALDIDYIITFGDYEKKVRAELARHNNSKIEIIHLGNSTKFKNANGDMLLNEITNSITGKKYILFGAVNIHTPQATALLNVFKRMTTDGS